MHATFLSIFPEMIPGFLGHSLAAKACEQGIWSYDVVNPRDFAEDKHGSVDDTPYGGGAGMVMRADVIGRAMNWALDHTLSANGGHPKCIYPSPRGTVFDQRMAQKWAKSGDALLFLCGRFEGVDQRLLDHYEFEEVSLGDFVLSGGEVAAMTMLDSVIRLLPGVVGNEETHEEESFSSNLLEYPHYTRPLEWQGQAVPEVLRSGNHAEIKKWRQTQAERLTEERRPDIWDAYCKNRHD